MPFTLVGSTKILMKTGKKYKLKVVIWIVTYTNKNTFFSSVQSLNRV